MHVQYANTNGKGVAQLFPEAHEGILVALFYRHRKEVLVVPANCAWVAQGTPYVWSGRGFLPTLRRQIESCVPDWQYTEVGL